MSMLTPPKQLAFCFPSSPPATAATEHHSATSNTGSLAPSRARQHLRSEAAPLASCGPQCSGGGAALQWVRVAYDAGDLGCRRVAERQGGAGTDAERERQGEEEGLRHNNTQRGTRHASALALAPAPALTAALNCPWRQAARETVQVSSKLIQRLCPTTCAAESNALERRSGTVWPPLPRLLQAELWRCLRADRRCPRAQLGSSALPIGCGPTLDTQPGRKRSCKSR